MSSLDTPPDWCSFDEIPRVLLAHPEWRMRQEPAKHAEIRGFFDSPDREFRDLIPAKAPISLLEDIMTTLFRRLSTRKSQAAAILEIGSVVWIPAGMWFLRQSVTMVSIPAIEAAFLGHEIWIQGDDGRVQARPIISFHELAIAFEAENPPERSDFPIKHLASHQFLSPEQQHERCLTKIYSHKKSEPDTQEVDHTYNKLLEYAKTSGRRIKRGDALSFLKKNFSYTSRKAQLIYRRLPQQFRYLPRI